MPSDGNDKEQLGHESPASPATNTGGKAETSQRHTSLKSGLAYAALVTLFLLIIKSFFEFSAVGHEIELTTYAALTNGLTYTPEKNRLDVVVLDLGGGSKSNEEFGENGIANGFDVKHPTDRERLKEIIDALAEAKAKALAVDIDFSPDSGGFIDRVHDPEFFEHCLQVSTTMPVFLGVFRTRSLMPQRWLGLPKYASLAVDLASTTGASEAFTKTHRFLVIPGRERQLPSLAYSLASQTGLQAPTFPARVINAMLNPTEEDSESGEGQLVNYTKVFSFHTQRSVALTRAAILGTKADFEGRLVVLGDDSGPHLDSDSIKWRFGLTFPRVLYHASAIYTYTSSPLYEFNFWTRNVLDVMFALPFFILVILRSKYEHAGAESHWKRIERRTMWISQTVIFLVGIFLVFALNIMWLDFVLVMIALALHPFLNEWMESRIASITGRWRVRSCSH
jgi:hypothetical protein